MPLLTHPRYWFVIPAAGVGARMGADKPKQYLMLGNKTILEHTLQRILSFPDVAGVVVALGREDIYWSSLTVLQHSQVHTIHGGETRAQSVLNGLEYLADKVHADDWILVHDAARPCVALSSIQKMCAELSSSQVGGILAVPVSDTIKQVEQQNEIQKTLDRSCLWQAQTPQMFRYELLHNCLSKTLACNENITDEASAIELCGFTPLVIEGRTDNIKITRPDDLALAEFILKQQEIQI